MPGIGTTLILGRDFITLDRPAFMPVGPFGADTIGWMVYGYVSGILAEEMWLSTKDILKMMQAGAVSLA